MLSSTDLSIERAGIKVLEAIDITDKNELFAGNMLAFVTVNQHAGLAFLMLKRYKDSARILSEVDSCSCFFFFEFRVFRSSSAACFRCLRIQLEKEELIPGQTLGRLYLLRRDPHRFFSFFYPRQKGG